MPEIQDDLEFKCPSCGEAVVEEVIDGAVIRNQLVYLSPEGDHDYDMNPIIEGGTIREFRCAKCLKPIPCEPNAQALADWLLDQEEAQDAVQEEKEEVKSE
jgi:hypothetical protein